MRQLKIKQQITYRAGESINRYFQDISKFAIISAEEEVELTIRIKKGDQIALEKLVLANLRFVVSVAKQYQNQGLSFPDLINEGNLGLVRAASKFDETKGFKFISYAVWWIRQAIMQAIYENTRIVRLPLNRHTSINKISKAIPYLEQELEREPSDEEIAFFLELNENDIHIANSIKKGHISFDMPVSNENSNEYTLLDIIQINNTPSPDEKLIQESSKINLNRALKKLTKREASILKMLYGLNDSKVYNLFDIADEFQMSTERIRQIKSSSILKLKKLLHQNLSLYNN